MQGRIRPASNDDTEELVRLSLLAWAPVFASFRQILSPKVYAIVYPDWQEQQRKVVEKVCEDSENTVVWVAEVDGTVTGFIAYTLHAADHKGVVELLAVHPEYQNRGVGTELNKLALEKMKDSGMRLAELTTGGDPGHAPARRAYEKAGYTPFPIVWYHKDL